MMTQTEEDLLIYGRGGPDPKFAEVLKWMRIIERSWAEKNLEKLDIAIAHGALARKAYMGYLKDHEDQDG